MAIRDENRLQQLVKLLQEFIQEEQDMEMVFLATDTVDGGEVIAMNVLSSESLADILDYLEQEYIEKVMSEQDTTSEAFWNSKGIYLN